MVGLGRSVLLLVATLVSTTVARGAVRPSEQPTPAELAMKQALEQVISASLIDTPLTEVADYFESACGIEIVFDDKALQDLGLDGSQTVTLDVNAVRVSTALWMVLNPLDCTYVPRDELLVITSKEAAREQVFARTYDVADLVWSPGYKEPDFESLIELITSTLAPTAWDEVGGPGAVQEYSSEGLSCLVISQTVDVHDEIAGLLESLRRTRDRRADARRTPTRREARKTRQESMPAARQRVYVTTGAWAQPRTHE